MFGIPGISSEDAEKVRLGSAKKALQAGYQMRRGLVPPLFSEELEPGHAVKQALEFTHPFTEDIVLDLSLIHI